MPAPSSRWTVAGPALLAAIVAAACLIWGSNPPDLAAASYRADLFADHGFLLWNNGWYSGHYLLSYSVIYPPLGALLGPRLVGALAAVAAAALFALLARRRFGAAAIVPSLWFAVGVASWMLTGRIPFLLAVPFGLAALLPRSGGKLWVAALFAALASLASPVGGLFVALAGAALGIAGERPRAVALVAGAALPIAVLNIAFPVGGEQPFALTSLMAVLALAAAIVWLVPAEYRALRIGAVIYALGAVLAYAIPTALGGNVTRLGALFAGPVLALVLRPRGRWVVIAVSIPLLYWQLVGPVRDVAKSAGEPSAERAFYEPLIGELERLRADGPPFRVEVPPTVNRWEADYVAAEFPLARGWLRQLESDDFELFSDDNLDASSYHAWLDDHGVGYVAVPNAPLDWLAEDEVDLIDAGLPYLRPVWDNPDWRLYRVDAGVPRLATAIGPDWFEIGVPRRGDYPVRINFTRTWTVTEGDACVSRGPNGDTVVRARAAGTIRVESKLGFGSGC